MQELCTHKQKLRQITTRWCDQYGILRQEPANARGFETRMVHFGLHNGSDDQTNVILMNLSLTIEPFPRQQCMFLQGYWILIGSRFLRGAAVLKIHFSQTTYFEWFLPGSCQVLARRVGSSSGLQICELAGTHRTLSMNTLFLFPIFCPDVIC